MTQGDGDTTTAPVASKTSWLTTLARLAWPAVVLVVIVSFRQPLIQLLAVLTGAIEDADSLEVTISDLTVKWNTAAVRLSGADEATLSKIRSLIPDAAAARRLSGKRVLWINDVPSDEADARSALEAFGIHFTLAVDEQNAIENLWWNEFDLIVTDTGRCVPSCWDVPSPPAAPLPPDQGIEECPWPPLPPYTESPRYIVHLDPNQCCEGSRRVEGFGVRALDWMNHRRPLARWPPVLVHSRSALSDPHIISRLNALGIRTATVSDTEIWKLAFFTRVVAALSVRTRIGPHDMDAGVP